MKMPGLTIVDALDPEQAYLLEGVMVVEETHSTSNVPALTVVLRDLVMRIQHTTLC